MANNYLITGYWGEPHVTSENDRGINAAIFGAGRFVLPVGEQFRAEYIGNNTVRMYDGKLMDNGAAAGIPAGEYIDILIAEAGQGKNRNDLIVFQYSQDASTLIESGTFVVIQGDETSGSATDPELTQDDLLSGKATKDQMALWRVSISGATISAPVQLFTVYSPGVGEHEHSAGDITSGTLGLSRGGTGATSAAAARTKLGAASTEDVQNAQNTADEAMATAMNALDHATSSAPAPTASQTDITAGTTALASGHDYLVYK